MTENESIKVLEETEKHVKIITIDGEPTVCYTTDMVKAFETAIQALEEIQRYRAIGTPEGYENAIKAYTETYILMKEYKSKLQDFEAIGTTEEFKALKDAEKQGLILKLPVAEGTNVFCIGSCGELCDDFDTDCEVCGEHEVVFCVNFDRNMVEQFGKTVFITEEEAEQALAKRQGK